MNASGHLGQTSLFFGMLVVVFCSCTLSQREGQLSCLTRDCPDNWVCNMDDQKCYSTPDAFPDNMDGGDHPTDDTESEGTDTGSEVDMPCKGLKFEDICWYLGEPGMNCVQVCAPHGTYNGSTPTHIGSQTQGGSRVRCEAILNALDISGTVVKQEENIGLGLGCYVWENGDLFWLPFPDLNPYHSTDQARLVCGCLN